MTLERFGQFRTRRRMFVALSLVCAFLIGTAALFVLVFKPQPATHVRTLLELGGVAATLPGDGWREAGPDQVGPYSLTSWVSSDNTLVFGVGQASPGPVAVEFGEYKESLGLQFYPGIPTARLDNQPAYELERNGCPASTAPY